MNPQEISSLSYIQSILWAAQVVSVIIGILTFMYTQSVIQKTI